MYITHDAEHLDQITQEIEQNESLMDPFAEQLRIETIKSMPQTLSVKRDIKAKITKTVDRRSSSKSMNFSTRIKYSLKSYFTKSRYFINSTIVNFEVWYNSMKEIEGHFGSGIGIYFKFLRSLLLMNIFLLVVVFG
jgi:transmembrane channel-like protein